MNLSEDVALFMAMEDIRLEMESRGLSFDQLYDQLKSSLSPEELRLASREEYTPPSEVEERKMAEEGLRVLKEEAEREREFYSRLKSEREERKKAIVKYVDYGDGLQSDISTTISKPRLVKREIKRDPELYNVDGEPFRPSEKIENGFILHNFIGDIEVTQSEYLNPIYVDIVVNGERLHVYYKEYYPETVSINHRSEMIKNAIFQLLSQLKFSVRNFDPNEDYITKTVEGEDFVLSSPDGSFFLEYDN